MTLSENMTAPDFSAIGDEGKSARLSDYLGSLVVLYFYPKDNTPGCTAEACEFRDNMRQIIALGAIVLGVSPDSASSHTHFREKHNLNFTLISDDDAKICNLYGAWGEKSMYGKKYNGVIRSTFLIDEQGIIRKIWRKVKVQGHVEDVMNAIKLL